MTENIALKPDRQSLALPIDSMIEPDRAVEQRPEDICQAVERRVGCPDNGHAATIPPGRGDRLSCSGKAFSSFSAFGPSAVSERHQPRDARSWIADGWHLTGWDERPRNSKRFT